MEPSRPEIDCLEAKTQETALHYAVQTFRGRACTTKVLLNATAIKVGAQDVVHQQTPLDLTRAESTR